MIVGAHDWTGQLAANGLVEPIYLKPAEKAQFPAYTLNAFSYGLAVKKLYGVPTQIENIGLVVDTGLVKVPTTFKQLEAEALAFKHKKSGNLAIAVQQGSGGDAYHMYPFFSGLGGYIFGTNSAGNLDPSNIGVANPKFLKNAPLIDKWNKEGLINAAVDAIDRAERLHQEAGGLLDHRPVELEPALDERPEVQGHPDAGDRVRLGAVPRRPGLHGHEVRVRARRRRAGAGSRRPTTSPPPTAQLALAVANGRYPANTAAGKKVNDPVLAQFGKAGAGGVPMPNIPQMNSVWSDLGAAWVKSTKGAGATKARVAFTAAARSIADKIG